MSCWTSFQGNQGPKEPDTFTVQEETQMQPEVVSQREAAVATPQLQAVMVIGIHKLVQEVQANDPECQPWKNNRAEYTAEGFCMDNSMIWKNRCHLEPGFICQ